MGEQNHQENKEKFTFIKEKIKDRPINKKKLLFQAVYTCILAALFGLVSCVVFFWAKPHVDEWLNPVEVQPVTLPPDEAEEEEEEVPKLPEPAPDPPPVVYEKVELTLEDFDKLYAGLYEMASAAASSYMVTVTGVSEDMDWFQNIYESKNATAGLVVADNRKELLILANRKPLEGSKTIKVKFHNGLEVEASLKRYDGNTNLGIVAVELSLLDEETQAAITCDSLGNSNANRLLGKPVIAIGNINTANSVAFGCITSAGNLVKSIDADHYVMTTDIYGGRESSGVLIDLSGKVIGVITHQAAVGGDDSLIRAYGISDLKAIVQKLSNGQDVAYLGIYGTDVPEDVAENQGVPAGAYVTDVEMGSPAMNEGIQSGDVITKIDTAEINGFADYENTMLGRQPGETAVITVMRYGKDGYTELNYEITLDKL